MHRGRYSRLGSLRYSGGLIYPNPLNPAKYVVLNTGLTIEDRGYNGDYGTPLWGELVERFYPQFEATYEKRYQERYGFWRSIIGTAVEKLQECGDLQQGFARVRCPDCGHEFFVAFSCRGRRFCPSCLPGEASAQAGHQKRALEKALLVSQEVCAPVAHRQFVFTIPKRLRIYFRFDRRLLGELCRAAWKVVTAVYGAASDHPEAAPGMIGAIQTFGGEKPPSALYSERVSLVATPLDG